MPKAPHIWRSKPDNMQSFVGSWYFTEIWTLEQSLLKLFWPEARLSLFFFFIITFREAFYKADKSPKYLKITAAFFHKLRNRTDVQTEMKHESRLHTVRPETRLLAVRFSSDCSRIVLHWQTTMCYQVPLATGTGCSLRSDGMQVAPLSQESNNVKDSWTLDCPRKSQNDEYLKSMNVSRHRSNLSATRACFLLTEKTHYGVCWLVIARCRLPKQVEPLLHTNGRFMAGLTWHVYTPDTSVPLAPTHTVSSQNDQFTPRRSLFPHRLRPPSPNSY